MTEKLLRFIDESPTAFGAVANLKKLLEEKGFKPLKEDTVQKNGKYYVTRNDSGIIAFQIGNDLKDVSLHMTASHTDCPSLKLKPNPILKSEEGIRLNVEQYGGMLKRPWLDRPLSLAGRVVINENGKIASRLYIDEEPFCIIPSMAPHLERGIEAKELDLRVDLAPVVSLNKDYDFNAYLALKTGLNKDDILGFDLYLYPLQKGYIWGKDKEFFTCGHIDNLECAYTTLIGFLNSDNSNNINVWASFDN